MKNLFDSSNYPTKEPSELVVGSRWAWTRPDVTETYPTDTYTLKYYFKLLVATDTKFTVTAGKVSSAHVVEEAITDTAKTPGEYSWQAVIVRDSDSEEVTIGTGFTTLQPDYGAETGDIRSQNYVILAAIRATIAQTATKEQASYSVAGRSLSRRTPEELMQLEREYKERWESELQEINRNNGRSSKKRTIVKMSA